MTAAFDYDALIATWIAEIEAALDDVVLAPGDRAYGIALWLLYAERGSVIYAPCVGLGTEADWESIRGGEPADAGFGSLRWNPADWPRSMLDRARTPRVVAAYDQLAAAACGGRSAQTVRGREHTAAEIATWTAAYVASTDALVRVARTLTRHAHDGVGPFARLALTPDFVAVVCDPSLGAEGEALLRACVDEPLASRLFPNVAARST